jgi:hypothetical protein
LQLLRFALLKGKVCNNTVLSSFRCTIVCHSYPDKNSRKLRWVLRSLSGDSRQSRASHMSRILLETPITVLINLRAQFDAVYNSDHAYSSSPVTLSSYIHRRDAQINPRNIASLCRLEKDNNLGKFLERIPMPSLRRQLAK